MEGTQLSSLLQNLFTPNFLKSFQSPFTQPFPVVYIHHSRDGEPEEIKLNRMYPFMTIQDIKTYIYLVKKKDPEYHPDSQALLIPLDASPSSQQTNEYFPLDYPFHEIDRKKKILSTFPLMNPFDRMDNKDVDTRFVTTGGDKKSLNPDNRSANTMEDLFPEIFGTNHAVIHLFLFADLVRNKDLSFLKAPRQWYGRIYPYFTNLPLNYEEKQSSFEETRYLEAKMLFVRNTIKMMDGLNDSLTSGVVTLLKANIVAVKYLRLFWKKPEMVVPDVESLFYQIPVTAKIPFLRILPSLDVPITKIHVESPLRIPSFDPRLIEQWSELKGPAKMDFLFGKVMIRDKEGVEPAMFGTLRIFEDRSADYTLQPPKNLKKFLLRDIDKFPEYLQSSIQDSYLENGFVDIKEVALVCSIQVGLKDVSEKQFLRRLKAFAPMFLEIPALPNERPVAMLRYRGVSNFTAEDKVFVFLTQYSSRKLVSGDIDENFIRDMIFAVMDVFQIRLNEAKTIVEKWISEKDKIVLNVAETNDFGALYNKGIDIAVFAQQATYSFHLYRVDSAIHLRRILTALSLLLNGSDEDFALESMADEFEEASSVIDQEEKKKEEEQEEQEEEADLEEAQNNAEGFDASLYASAVDETGSTGEEEKEQEEEEQEEEEPIDLPLATLVKPRIDSKKPRTEEIETKAKPMRDYFTKKMYDADPELFPSTKELAKSKEKESSAKRSGKRQSELKQSYSAKCQSTEDRQPIVMTEEQYEAMKDVYGPDEVTFLEFPRYDDLPLTATGEVVYVLRYGSSSLKMNYYLCCKYFCIKDYIMILKKDFEGTTLRRPKIDEDGNEILTKEPNTCPFCEGELIVDKTDPGPNQWVYRRVDGNNQYIKLLTHTVHDKGIKQPCCFGRVPKYRTTDEEFSHLSYRTTSKEEAERQEQEERDERASVITSGTQKEPLNYAYTLVTAHKKYIVEKAKMPLEVGDKGGPQIGLLPEILDPYFQQVDEDIVHKPQQKQELKLDSKAFLRVGVDNRQFARSESFFSAIAPFLDSTNTANDVRNRLLIRIHPRNFLFFNYGNLLLEFYNPSDAGLKDTELRLWSQKNLEVQLADENKDAVLRLWKSYHRFVDFLNDKTALKEYRQFAQMLALPGLLTPRGVVFIVLDIVLDKDNMEKLEVRCPPYGYDNEQFSDADIGFLLHHYSGIWEPIFYSENERAHRQFGDRHDVILKFQRSQISSWPTIVQKRVLEFTQKCSGPGRAAWTSGSLVDPFAMIPVSRLIQGMAQAPEGVIRDSYNHIVALTFHAEAGKTRLVAVPVVDDGTIVTPARLHFDWNDYTPAGINEVADFYRENIEPIFSYYPGYTVKYAVRDISVKKINAVQLANGIFIPCAPLKGEINESSSAILGDLKLIEIEQMEWAINRDIIFGKRDTPDPMKTLKTQERKINEAFEYLRLTFSNWFASEEVSSELRENVRKVIFEPNYPLFERRKRLDILLGPIILSWMEQDDEFRDEQKALLRVDCRLLKESKCSGHCMWKTSESKCLLHVPKPDEPEGDEVEVNVPLMLTRRLFEELIRFPLRRNQLLEKKVSPLVSLREPVRVGDQYIVPQSSYAWYELLQLQWSKQTEEKKKFYEEMSEPLATASIPPPKEENKARGELSEMLKERLGEGEELEGLYLYQPTFEESSLSTLRPFLVSLGVFESDIGLEEDATVLTDDAMRALVLLVRRPIIQFNFQGGNEEYSFFGPAKKQKDPTPLILITMDQEDGGVSMLSLSPTSPIPVPVDRLPSGVKYYYDERVLVSDSEKK